jgi:hypothetical protein
VIGDVIVLVEDAELRAFRVDALVGLDPWILLDCLERAAGQVESESALVAISHLGELLRFSVGDDTKAVRITFEKVPGNMLCIGL